MKVVSFGSLVDKAATWVDSGDIPACQVAVARRGQLELFEALGEAEASTRFAVYSATKPIVASAVWRLIDEGRLDVSAPVAKYVPEFTGEKETVTVEQVMLHTGGFPDAPMRPEEGADAAVRRERFRQWRLDWEPGSRFVYHGSSAHWVLADLIERIEEKDFRDAIEERVTRPLGLPRLLGISPPDQADIAPPAGLAKLPDNDPARYLATPSAIAAGVPGGGGIMTAADLALFYQGILENSRGLWSGETLRDVTQNIRCRFVDPLMKVPVNRTLGLVVAGDDGKHIFRYACFGAACSPGSFGHAGAHGQVAWADPATGISFSFVHNGLQADMRRSGARAVELSTMAAEAASST